MQNYIQHTGVKGMKWGHRMARDHAGPGKYATVNRQLKGDQKDLDHLNKGGHLSVGLTKSRQDAYDKRDKAKIEKRIEKNQQVKSSRIIGPVGEGRRKYDQETRDARKERTRLRTESRKNYEEFRKTGKESYRKLAEKYYDESYSEFCNKGSRMTAGEATVGLLVGLSLTALSFKYGGMK